MMVQASKTTKTTTKPQVSSLGRTRRTTAWRTCAGRVGASRSSTRTPRIRTAGRAPRSSRSRSKHASSGRRRGCRTLRLWRRLGNWGCIRRLLVCVAVGGASRRAVTSFGGGRQTRRRCWRARSGWTLFS